ncbi:MAG: hypothetical protein GF317_11490, partial [Candidatus Lokiarchaeota archaeon]|nr:hypothetical protein [Candidatus Lokiarchaeota archaeon]MBD3200274.1 hypothetical protein [Candidatus Lokiarchaeota archaeon]
MMNLIYHPLLKNLFIENPIDNIFMGLENLCEVINGFFILFFSYVKYIFAIILLIIGLMTLFRQRGIYKLERLRTHSKNLMEQSVKDKLKQTHVILGMIYICMSLGIIFKYFTICLMWILEPLPDGFIFSFINFFEGINPEYIERLSDLDAALYPHEKTVFFVLAFFSFTSLIQIFVSVWTIINNGNRMGNPKMVYTLLFTGLVEGMLAGFT